MAIGGGLGRALFGNASGSNQSKNLIEFRAGKMELKGTMVHPDKRKGMIYVHQTDDSLMHFCWKDRTSGAVVDDLIIFPDDVEFKRVSQCTTGRVYILKFRSTNRKLFFWMQEPKTDKDEEYCKKVNDYLNNPPAPGANRSGGSTPGSGLPSELSNIGDSDLQTLLNNMSQQQLMQLFGNVGGMSNLSSLLGSRSTSIPSSRQSTTTPAITHQDTTPTPTPTVTQPTTSTATATAPAPTTTTAITTNTTTATATATATATTPTASATPPTGNNIQLSDLQSILSGIRVPPPTEESQPRTPIDLSTAVNVEALQPVLNNPEFIQRLQTLVPHAEGGGPPEAMSMFSAALQSGQLGPLMQQFGLEDTAIAAASQGDMETFVRALQSSLAQANKPPEGDGSEKVSDKKDDDEDMALD